MWKNPETVLRKIRGIIFPILFKESFQTKPFPSFPEENSDVNSFMEAHRVIAKAYDTICHSIIDNIDASPDERRQVTRTVFDRTCIDIAHQVEKTRDWLLIHRMWLASLYSANLVDFADNREDARPIIAFYITEAVHLLVGNEMQYLVGLRHSQPAWKKLASQLTSYDLPKANDIGPDLIYIGAEDVDILPDVRAWAMNEDIESLNLPEIENVWKEVADILEDAYYNQQYLPHPDGSLVRVLGIAGIESVVVKAKRSISDPNYLDFMGVYNLGDKKWPVIFSGTRAMERPGDESYMSNPGSPFIQKNFLSWLLARIYHDLVTAKDVDPGVVRKVSQKGGLPKSPEGLEGLSWIYIPRKRKKETLEIRRPSSSPRSMTPHRVRGHKRKANMTEQQRQAIQELERETGLDILKWVPDGYTFVRPHVAPKDGSESLDKLPRFIRTRIQDDIKQLLES